MNLFQHISIKKLPFCFADRTKFNIFIRIKNASCAYRNPLYTVRYKRNVNMSIVSTQAIQMKSIRSTEI